MFLKESLPAGFAGVVLFHVVPWFTKGGGEHRDVGYQSDDKQTIANQLDAILKYGGGLPASQLGVIVDWYGPNAHPVENSATLGLVAGCEVRGMKFALCFDVGIFKWQGGQSGMVTAYKYAKSIYFPSPAYVKDENGKLLITDFDAWDTDWNSILGSDPVRLVRRGVGASGGGYTWVGDVPAGNAKVYMPALNPGFDDHDFKNPANSVWGGPARFTSYAGGSRWTASCASIPKTAKFVQVVTLNDHEERTGILANLGMPGWTPPSDIILPVGSTIPNVVGVVPVPPPPDPTPVPGPGPVPVPPPDPVPVPPPTPPPPQPAVTINASLVAPDTKWKVLAELDNYAGFSRWEVWDDDRGVKLFQSTAKPLTASITIPSNTHHIVVQAATFDDRVIAKKVFNI